MTGDVRRSNGMYFLCQRHIHFLKRISVDITIVENLVDM